MTSPTPRQQARKLADSAMEDPLTTEQAIELAKAYATLDLADAVRANTRAARTPRS